QTSIACALGMAPSIEAIQPPGSTTSSEPDAELRDLPTTPGQRVYHGGDGLLQWAESMMQAFADYRFEPQEITEVGNFIVVAVRISARGLGSGVPTDMQVFHVFERSANGLMQSIAGFLDRAEAL